MTPRTPGYFAFPAHKRLKKQADFDAVYAAKAVKRAGPLRVHALPSATGHHRLGLSIGVRVGSAVVRNRLKRMLRESFRLLQHDLPGAYDLVVVGYAHEPLGLADYQQLVADAVEQLHRHWTKRQQKGSP